jgi:hypothetical protein
MGGQDKNQGTDSRAGRFIEEANAEQTGFIREFLHFLMHNQKWWLTPIIVVLLLALLIVLGGSAAAPFNYALF